MSLLAPPVSFEYLCYGSTIIINILIISLRDRLYTYIRIKIYCAVHTKKKFLYRLMVHIQQVTHECTEKMLLDLMMELVLSGVL